MISGEELPELCFEIIASVGAARSSYIEAIQEAKEGHIAEAHMLVKAGEQEYLNGHHAHAGLIQEEAAGTAAPVCLLLTHAEDQLMSAEAFGILAEEFIDLYERLGRIEAATINKQKEGEA